MSTKPASDFSRIFSLLLTASNQNDFFAIENRFNAHRNSLFRNFLTLSKNDFLLALRVDSSKKSAMRKTLLWSARFVKGDMSILSNA